jgi:hypothetical protein
MATLLKWEKFIDEVYQTFGVRAVGEINGKRFHLFIRMSENFINDSDFDLEGYVRKEVENTKEEDIATFELCLC